MQYSLGFRGHLHSLRRFREHLHSLLGFRRHLHYLHTGPGPPETSKSSLGKTAKTPYETFHLRSTSDSFNYFVCRGSFGDPFVTVKHNLSGFREHLHNLLEFRGISILYEGFVNICILYEGFVNICIIYEGLVNICILYEGFV